MVVLITGGSGSGKSAYAEEYITKLPEVCRKYYIATMLPKDKDALEKIRKHQKMREGKTFITIEQPTDILEARKAVEKEDMTEGVALLECMSNLVANEMFCDGKVRSSKAVEEKILCGIETLRDSLKHLIIVTNNVFEDGCVYEETTMNYLAALGSINKKLAQMADKVIEVVVGIPVITKGG